MPKNSLTATYIFPCGVVCTCVYTCVRARVCVHAFVTTEARGWLRVSSFIALYRIFWDGVSHWTQSSWIGRLTDVWALRTHLSLLPPSTRVIYVLSHWDFSWGLEIQTQSLVFALQFAIWAMSPDSPMFSSKSYNFKTLHLVLHSIWGHFFYKM